MKRFRSKADRDLMSVSLAMDPLAKEHILRLFRMGAHNIRHDWMYVLNRETGKYDRVPDPSAFNADINVHVGVSLLRTRDGQWFLNGQ